MPLWVTLFIIFAVCLILRVPIAVSLGVSALICLWSIDVPLVVVGQKMFTAIDQFTLMAIPFFILSGNLMCEGGISRRLCDFCNSLLWRVRGSVAAASVLACAFFGALSGSGPATVISIGSMMYPDMVDRGYPKREVAGLMAVAGGLGPLIPPSIVMVVYGCQTNTSIGDMFIAGAGIGLTLAVMLMIMVIFRAYTNKWPANEGKMTFLMILKSAKNALFALGMPVIVLGGIYGGIFTPTEAACVAVVYAFIVGKFIYKTLSWQAIPGILKSSAIGSAIVLFIVSTSTVFAWLFSYAGFTTEIVNVFLAADPTATQFMLGLSVVLLIFGCFMDATPIIILIMPIVLPIAQSLGIHPIHLGMVVCMGGVIGMMTPPVALNIFAIGSVSKLSVEEITKGELRYFFTAVACFYLVVLIPQLSTFLLA